MGTSQFFVLTSEHPEYNSKIKLANLMAPVGYTEHMTSPIALIAPFANQVDVCYSLIGRENFANNTNLPPVIHNDKFLVAMQWLLRMFGMWEFLPTDPFMDLIGATLCHQNSPVQGLCANALFLICGWDVSQFDPVSY
jgi:lysosomal acid lipase/cholesteryl ester hydrolase